MCVGSVCDYGWRADVMRRSCGGWLIGSLTPRLSIAPLLDTDGGEGSGASSLLAFFGFLLLRADFVNCVIAVAMAASP